MKTVVKYIFYLALLAVVYIVAKGVWEGSITDQSTVSQVATDVKDGAQNMAGNVVREAKKFNAHVDEEMEKDVNEMKSDATK